VGSDKKLSPDAAVNHAILHKMGVAIHPAGEAERIEAALGELGPRDVVVDALLGTGFQGKVRQPMSGLIEGVNRAKTAAVVAVDVPSGLDCTTGEPSNATVRATSTVTFVARKRGFDAPGAAEYTGEVIVADIGAPPDLVDRVCS
jgi:NAD(P)H-hydrate epimerase